MARPKIDNSGAVDVLADVVWVYNNAQQLYDIDGKINPRILAMAPSSGAHVLARYAAAHFQAFCERFVIKLLPKDSAQTETSAASKAAAAAELLDPDFDALSQFMKPIKEEGHEAPEMEFDSTEGTDSEHPLPQASSGVGADEEESSSVADEEVPI